MFGEILKAAVGVVKLPLDVAADIVNAGGVMDGDKTRTAEEVRQIFKNLDNATKPKE